METKINNQAELRSAVASINADVVALCNAETIEQLCDKFMEVKNRLIEIYKYNVDRIQENK